MANAGKQPALSALIVQASGNHGWATHVACEAAVPVKFRRGVGRPVVGDRVELETIDDGFAVTHIAARDNTFLRADRRGTPQPIAANLHQAVVMVAAQPVPKPRLLDRYISACEYCGVSPLIVANKSDLMDADGKMRWQSRLAVYQALGYTTLMISAAGDAGLQTLGERLQGRRSLLVGQSGVGKSTLAGKLLPTHQVTSGALSVKTGKGRHTTTTTQLYELPQGGQLIDSPGVWEFGLWSMTLAELAATFVEFRPHLGHCKFNDCRHLGEPGCAIVEAVAKDDIDPRRYGAYHALSAQNAGS